MTPSPRSRPSALRAGLVVLGAAAALVLGAAPAAAHDALASSDPADGQRVATAPASVTLTFEEAPIALGTQVVVAGPDGPVSTGEPQLTGLTVTQPLRPGTPAGRYTVTWRVTSDDGHPVSGTFAFTADAPAAGTGSPAPTSGGTATPPATAFATPASSSPSPAVPATREPLIPSWGWIAAGVIVILGAVRVARRSRGA